MPDAELWLRDNLRLALSRESGTSSDLFTSAFGLRLLKAVTEVSYFSIYGSYRVSNEFITFLREIITAIFSDTRFFNVMRFNQRCSMLFLALGDAAHQLNVLSSHQYEDILKLADIYSCSGPERVAFRVLDLLYGLTNIGIATDDAEWNAAISCGCTGSTRKLKFLSNHDAYAFTHTIFYQTDFGRLKNVYSAEKMNDIVICLERLSRHSGVTKNIDLLSEYLLCYGYLRHSSRFVDELQSFIERSQQADGSWHGPALMDASLSTLGVPDHQFYFYNHYHTTLLAWQATKVGKVDRSDLIKRTINPSSKTSIRAQTISSDYIRACIYGIEEPSDICEIIWFARIFGFSLEDEETAILDQLRLVKSDKTANYQVKKLVFVFFGATDTPTNMTDSDEELDVSNLDRDKYDRIFVQLSQLTTQQRNSMILNAIAHYSIDCQPNLFIRFCALGIAYEALDKQAIKDAIEIADSFYSAHGSYMWAENQEADNFSKASGIIGQMLMHRAEIDQHVGRTSGAQSTI